MSEENEVNDMDRMSKIEVHDEMVVQLTDLSYKELQNVAISLSLPGNLKWSQLLQLVQARQRGDEDMVTSIVSTCREQRGKRRQAVQGEGKRRKGASVVLPRDCYLFPQVSDRGLVIQMGADSSSSRGGGTRWARSIAPMPSQTETAPVVAQSTNGISSDLFGISECASSSSHILRNLLSSNSSCTVTTGPTPGLLQKASMTTSPQPLCLTSQRPDDGSKAVLNPFSVPSRHDDSAVTKTTQDLTRFQLDAAAQDDLLQTVPCTSPYGYLYSDNANASFPSGPHCQYMRSELASPNPCVQYGYRSSGSLNTVAGSQCQYFPSLLADGNGAPGQYRQVLRSSFGRAATATVQPLYHALRPSSGPMSPVDASCFSLDHRSLLDQQFGHGYQTPQFPLTGQHVSDPPPPLLPLAPNNSLQRLQPTYLASHGHMDPLPCQDVTLSNQEAMPGIQKARTATVSCYTEPICTYMQYSSSPLEMELASPGSNVAEDHADKYPWPHAEEVSGYRSTYFPEFRHNNQLSYPLIYNYLASTEDQLLEQQQQQQQSSELPDSNPAVPDDEPDRPRATSSPLYAPSPSTCGAANTEETDMPRATSSPLCAPSPSTCGAANTEETDVPQLDESTLSLMCEAQPSRTQCKHHNNGCLMILGLEQAPQHEQACEYQDMECPVHECSWNDRLKSLATHLTEEHQSAIMSGLEKSHMAPVHTLRARQKMSFLQETGGRLYVVNIHCCGHLLQATIQAVPSGRADRAILARGTLEVIAKDGRPLSWRGRVRPIHEPVTNLWTLKQCLTLDPSVLGLHAGSKVTLHAMVTVDKASTGTVRRRKKQRIV